MSAGPRGRRGRFATVGRGRQLAATKASGMSWSLGSGMAHFHVAL
jgi:hypothetical protein